MHMRFAFPWLAAVLATGALVAAEPSFAAPVKVNFTGTLAVLFTAPGLLDGSISSGDDVSGSYVFDPDTALNLLPGNYADFGPNSGLTLQMGSYTLQPDLLTATSLTLTDESGLGSDNFTIATTPETVQSTNPAAQPLFNGATVLSLTGDASVLSSLSLSEPALTQPQMGSWMQGTLSFSAEGSESNQNFFGIIWLNSLSLETSAVPEPGAFALLAGSAAVGAAFLRRRR